MLTSLSELFDPGHRRAAKAETRLMEAYVAVFGGKGGGISGSFRAKTPDDRLRLVVVHPMVLYAGQP